MAMLNEADFVKQYSDLLIKQYWEKPKAKAEIELMARTWYKIYRLLYSFDVEYDLDNAYGHRLDVIGRIVGIDRLVPNVIPKVFFGFADNVNARGFASKFNPNRPSAPFFSKFGQAFTSLELGDADYKFFIRAKILKNSASAYISSDELVSIQDVVVTLFNGEAYAVDNKDMTLSVVIPSSFDEQRLNLIKSLDLIPTPLGVELIYDPAVLFAASRWHQVANYVLPESFA